MSVDEGEEDHSGEREAKTPRVKVTTDRMVEAGGLPFRTYFLEMACPAIKDDMAAVPKFLTSLRSYVKNLEANGMFIETSQTVVKLVKPVEESFYVAFEENQGIYV